MFNIVMVLLKKKYIKNLISYKENDIIHFRNLVNITII